MKEIPLHKIMGLLDDLKREYEKSIGWSSLSDDYFMEIKRILVENHAKKK